MKLTDITHPLYFDAFPQGAIVTARAHGLDISKYDSYFRPETATGQLDFVIQRLSYRVTRDEAFEALLPGVLQVPIRGGYHYLNSDTDWRSQADKFLSIAAGHDYHFFACDLEGAFNVMSQAFAYQAWQFIHYVQDRTGKRCELYTSLGLYNSYVAPSAARYGVNWNGIGLWQAQWFTIPNPNGTPGTPTGRTGGWNIWQYTARGNGPLYGVARPTACDLDVYNGSVAQMRERYNVGAPIPNPPPTDDTITELFAGVRQIAGTRHGWKFWLQISDPRKVRYEVVHPNPLAAVSWVATARAQMAWNGGEWDRVSYPKDYSVSNELEYVPRRQAVPSLMVLEDGSLRIDHRTTLNVEQAISGLRYLINDGVIRAYLDGTEPQYTEGHSRSVHGLDANGHHMVLTSNGVYPNQGLTLKQAAEIMKQYGAQVAFDSGGGGDATVFVNGTVLNTPEDIDNAVHVERRLPQILLAYVVDTTTPQPGGTMQFRVTALAKLWRTYSGGALGNQIGTISVGTIVTGTIIADGIVQLTSPVGYTKTNWLEQIATPPPPPPPTGPTKTHTIETYDDGSLKIDGNPYP